MIIPIGDDIQKRTPPFGAIALIAINGLVYLYEHRLFLDEPERGSKLYEFILQWGLIPKDLESGQYHGVISHMFLHGDFWHFFFNMLILWAFAATVEAALGIFEFLVLYVSWGIASGLASAYMNWGETIPGIGASGAIFGVIGAYFVTFGPFAQMKCLVSFVPWKWYKVEIPAGLFVLFWQLIPNLMGMMETANDAPNTGGVGWYAHGGGFLAGALSMLVFGSDAIKRTRLNREGKWEVVTEASEDCSHEHSSTPIEPVPDEMSCNYCRTELAPENKMGDLLYRCPNPECKRLNYVSTTVAPAVAGRR